MLDAELLKRNCDQTKAKENLKRAIEICKNCGADGSMPYRISDDCIECGACFDTCRQRAIIDPQGNRSPKKANKKKLATAHIDPSICAGSKTCFLNCPQEAISVVKKGIFSSNYFQVDANDCVGCGTCAHYSTASRLPRS